MPDRIDHFEFEPRDAFEFQPGTDPYRVLDFLAGDSGEWFTIADITAAIDMDHGSARTALDRLEHRNLVHRDGRKVTIAPPDTEIDWSNPGSSRGPRSDHSGGG